MNLPPASTPWLLWQALQARRSSFAILPMRQMAAKPVNRLIGPPNMLLDPRIGAGAPRKQGRNLALYGTLAGANRPR